MPLKYKEGNNGYENLGLIIAIGQNNEIGFENDLIWKIPEDLSFFKNITMDSFIIMGKNTYNSMPKNLKGRKYVVLSRDENFCLDEPKLVHRSVEETLDFVSINIDSLFWVIGGGTIYEAFLPYVNMMHITRIEASLKIADTFFPEFNLNEWDETIGEQLHCSVTDIDYKHLSYIRK